MKTLLVFSLLLFFVSEEADKMLTSNSWRVYSFETFEKINDTYDYSHPQSHNTSTPVCGQVVSFNADHSIRVSNSGEGLWANIDKYEWSVEKSILHFKSLDPHSFSSLQFIIAFRKDSTIKLRSVEMTGIETGIKRVHVWTLIKEK
jgi:hypothetical protein